MSDIPVTDESVDYPPTPNIGEQPDTFGVRLLATVDLSDKPGEYQQIRAWITTSGKKIVYVGTDNGAQHKRPFTYHTALTQLTVVRNADELFRAVDRWHQRLAHYYENKTITIADVKRQALATWFA